TDGGDPAWIVVRELLDGQRKLGSCTQRVTATVHWGAAGMVGPSVEGRNETSGPGDASDETDRAIVVLEQRALFDMQLDVDSHVGWAPARLDGFLGVNAGCRRQHLRKGLAFAVGKLQMLIAQCAADRATTEV